jgi:subtilisin family serine protease
VGPDDWIVVFRDDVVDPPGLARQLIATHGGSLRFTYQYALKGFAATLPAQAIEGIRNNPNVAYVEADGVVTIGGSGTDLTPGSWGLDRIDQRPKDLNGTYNWSFDGSGVHAYIIDTGILETHQDFGGRASADFDAVGDGQNGNDCHGHGTHVAGTVGGLEYGVAKSVRLHGVRVLNCFGSGSWADVISGIDYVTGEKQASPNVPAVANMSLGGGFSQSINDAVNGSVEAGVTFAVSAGNDNRDACTKSPASAADALTVGSTTSSDSRSSFSNFGTCVDVFAPGSSITSAWKNSDTDTNTISGTSMSSPHVAGAAALYLDEYPSAAPAVVAQAIEEAATTDAISNLGMDSPNLLLHSLFDGSGGTNPLPTDVSVSAVSGVALSGRKHKSGTVQVTVLNDGSVLTSNVTITGDWFKNGETSVTKSSSDVTGPDGIAKITSGAIKGASSLQFCVTGLSGTGFSDVTVYPWCSPEAGGGGSDEPVDDLTAKAKTKGRARVNLSWTPWSASSVDVWRDGSLIDPISNSGSYTDWAGVVGMIYKVCEADTSACTNEATAK